MFFKDHFISISDIIDAKFRGHEKTAKNPADKGELCEIFIKEFLIDSLGDSFKIFRGGRIINSRGDESKQLDIILTGKRTIKIFGDKGIYPTETVYGCVSITATLTKSKLIDCCSEFLSIPKEHFNFTSDGYISPKFVEQSLEVWKQLAPYKCIFAYKGEIKGEWIDDILNVAKDSKIPHNVIPDLIIVNKVGMIEKGIAANGTTEMNFVPFDTYLNYGAPFGKMLYHLNTFNWEELILRPEIKYYLDKDLET